MTQILAHEVGHHLICSRGYVFAGGEKYSSKVYEEEMADRYAFEILRKMKKKWYYRQGEKLMKFVSEFYILSGSEQWKKANYDKAAIFWNKAWALCSENEELVKWYWKARKKADDKASTVESIKS